MDGLVNVTERKLLALVRELAIGIQPIEDILKLIEMTPEQYELVRNTDRFKTLYEDAVVAWGAATNAQERLKLKSAVALEDFVTELYGRLHDRAEPLNHKVEGAKLLARIAGVGVGPTQNETSGEKFTVTINLGADQSIKFEKPLPTRVIDSVAVEGE